MRVIASCLGIVALVSFVSRGVFAQEPPAAQPPAPPPPPAAAPAPAPPPPPAPPPKDDGVADHDRFVGHFAVGYFGISDLPVATVTNAGGNPTVDFANPTPAKAPIIGVRYWLQPKIGLDLGVGFASVSGSRELVQGTQDQTTDTPSTTAFAFHVGVPIALATAKHFTWEVIPEATLGFTSGTIKAAPAQPGQPANPDTNLSGFFLDVGARAGAEIHFGFIGVPELALQGSIGLHVRREAAKYKIDPNSASVGRTTIGTTVGADPWALFVNNISALYYF